ncbi:MAG: nitrogen regulatory protein P-II 1 [Thermoanaerobaculum sp.]|nr:MAG: nitrogen regulatory protein P-II 1 [Thermoanaerobaculum sp.]
MKLIVAFIQPYALERVEHALLRLPRFPGLSVSEVRGYGQGKAAEPLTRREELVEFTKKLRLEIACLDEDAEPIVEAIQRAAHTGQRGDGKIWVLSLADAVRIRTGERGHDAIRSPLRDEGSPSP